LGKADSAKKDESGLDSSLFSRYKHYALSTLPDLKQEVQTYIFLLAAPTFTLTDLMFAFHILFDLL